MDPQPGDPLTQAREVTVCFHISEGMRGREIAAKLGISHRTVEVHRANIFRKMGVSNAAQLTRAVLLGELGKAPSNV
jgi:two-component system uhpT operon response regulator UhpA